MLDTFSWGRSYASTKIIESPFAVVPPQAPISDDMRCMVDDLQRFGQIRMKPGALSLPDGTMVVHPDVYAALNKRLAADADQRRDRMFMDAIYGRGFR